MLLSSILTWSSSLVRPSDIEWICKKRKRHFFQDMLQQLCAHFCTAIVKCSSRNNFLHSSRISSWKLSREHGLGNCFWQLNVILYCEQCYFYSINRDVSRCPAPFRLLCLPTTRRPPTFAARSPSPFAPLPSRCPSPLPECKPPRLDLCPRSPSRSVWPKLVAIGVTAKMRCWWRWPIGWIRHSSRMDHSKITFLYLLLE